MRIDEFESQFKRAIREPYELATHQLKTVVVISDKSPSEAQSTLEATKNLFPYPNTINNWVLFNETTFDSVRGLLHKLSEQKPDLVVVERNLKTDDDNLVYGLSNYVDALTQVYEQPVLLMPAISNDECIAHSQAYCDIIVETNNLVGASSLVNWAVQFCTPQSKLFLTHIEDSTIFQRYMNVIEKIPQISTDVANSEIRHTLLELPWEYALGVQAALESTKPGLEVRGIVQLGHALHDMQRVLSEHPARILVIPTRVEGQLAMSGIAYVSAVEFKHLPLLLL